MTNNPTIDGVSRELLTDLIKIASRNVKSAWSGSVCEEARALLDPPAVERQPAKCGQCGSTSTDICNQNGCGFLESGNGEPAVERQEPDSNSWRLNSEIRCPQCVGHGTYLDGEQCGTCSGSGLKSGASLQSTIAQLQARIAELESGRGEPVAWVELDESMSHGKTLDWYQEDIKTLPLHTKLYIAPPAPVAVVLPERRTPEHYHQRIGKCGAADMLAEEWNACRDATAALNGERK